MKRTKTLQGTGNHAVGFEEDLIRSDDGILSIEDLIPDEFKDESDSGIGCARWGERCFKVGMPDEGRCRYCGEDGICKPPRFRFRITAEFEEID